jgi:hypothetical protein
MPKKDKNTNTENENVVDITPPEAVAYTNIIHDEEFIEPHTLKQTARSRRLLRKGSKIKDGHTLNINGKRKLIGRKSHYLLDMMIIAEE